MEIYQRVQQLIQQGDRVSLAIVIRTQGSVPRREGSKMLVFPDGRIEGTVGGGQLESRVIAEAVEALGDGRTRVLHYAMNDPEGGDPGVCGGEVEVFVEPIEPRPTIVVVGGGHVGKAVGHLAHWLGFRVVVSDDRPEFASVEAYPEVDEIILGPLVELPDQIEITPSTYILLTTRGVGIDVGGLPALMATQAAYIGVIGSRRRWELCVKQLKEMGVPQEKLDRVTSPMGLEINAETPEEIAVSMLAEIILLRRGGTGLPMAHAAGPRRAGKGG
ncbi:MAG TPA: XdhC family protein [Anaerolineales bacterium]|nr:XdhC family protein [Anaerolineales bacterium]